MNHVYLFNPLFFQPLSLRQDAELVGNSFFQDIAIIDTKAIADAH